MADHYASDGIVRRILAVLDRGEAITPYVLAPMNQFHGRGLPATEELIAVLQPRPGDHLLDIGCGIGRPARWIADKSGCHVTGIDLTPAFCAAARELTRLTGQEGAVEIIEGNALDLPFADESFQAAYTQNVAMNIADKRGFYTEAMRLLEPGGLFSVSNVCEGENGPPHYPAPWAESEADSFLVGLDETGEDLCSAGFQILSIRDTTDDTRPASVALGERLEREGFPARYQHVSMGEKMKRPLLNWMRSARDGRLRTIEALARRPA